MKTALMELIEKLDKEIKNAFIKDAPILTQQQQLPFKIIRNKATQLLETEKQQIIDAYAQGEIDLAKEIMPIAIEKGLVSPKTKIPKNDKEDAEQYYTKTFNP